MTKIRQIVPSSPAPSLSLVSSAFRIRHSTFFWLFDDFLRCQDLHTDPHSNSQLSLGWLLTRPEKIIPIPGTKRTRYLEENIGALSVKLRQDELDEIDRIMPGGIAAGTRYSEQMMKLVGR